MTTKTARGVRLNNPGNIDRHDTTKWQGMAKDQPDPRFVSFVSPQYGIRAIGRTLLTYQNQHGCDTIHKLISRWAPPVENDTGSYVAAVASGCGVGPDDVVDVDQVAIALPLVKAIIKHENGGCPYADSLILEGLRMAGIADAKPAPIATSKPFVAQVATGVAVAGATVAQYSGPLKTASDQLAAFTGAPVIAHVQTILLTIAGICVTAGIVASWAKHKAGQ